jgi:hypothetical protein
MKLYGLVACVGGRKEEATVNLLRRLPLGPNLFYIQPGEGASCDVLVRRVAYGGRKGLSALCRLNRHCKHLNVHGTPDSVPLFPVTCDCGAELSDFDEAAAHECPADSVTPAP